MFVPPKFDPNARGFCFKGPGPPNENGPFGKHLKVPIGTNSAYVGGHLSIPKGLWDILLNRPNFIPANLYRAVEGALFK